MTVRIIITTVVAYLVGLVSTHDVLTNLINSVLAASLCFIPLFILSRRPFLKSATGSVQTLVSVLVCMLALSVVGYILMANRVALREGGVGRIQEEPALRAFAGLH